MGHNRFNPFLIHIFLFRLNSYSSNSFTKLNECLRVFRSERERKMEHRMHFQNFKKQCLCSSEPMRPAKVLAMLNLHSSGRPLYMAPRSSVNFPARADTMSVENSRKMNLMLEQQFTCLSGNQNSGTPRILDVRSSGDTAARA